MNKSDSIKELATALAKAQAEMVNPKFDTENPFFKSKYASLAAVRDAVLPILAKHGLSIIQSLGSTDKGVECETMLMHISGEWVSGLLSLPITKHDAQGYGSAATYARRYTLMSFSGVVGDSDDDANAASEAKPTKKGRNDPPVATKAQPPELATVLDAIAKMVNKAERAAAKALADQLTGESQIAMAEAAWATRIEELKKPATGGEV